MMACRVLGRAPTRPEREDDPNLWRPAAVSPFPLRAYGIAPAILTRSDHVATIEFVKIVRCHLVESVLAPLYHPIAEDPATELSDGGMVQGFVEHEGKVSILEKKSSCGERSKN